MWRDFVNPGQVVLGFDTLSALHPKINRPGSSVRPQYGISFKGDCEVTTDNHMNNKPAPAERRGLVAIAFSRNCLSVEFNEEEHS